MCPLANNEDPDEMPYNVAFHQGLQYLPSNKNHLQRKINNFYLELKTCDLSIYTMDHPKFIVSNQKEEFIKGHISEIKDKSN